MTTVVLPILAVGMMLLMQAGCSDSPTSLQRSSSTAEIRIGDSQATFSDAWAVRDCTSTRLLISLNNVSASSGDWVSITIDYPGNAWQNRAFEAVISGELNGQSITSGVYGGPAGGAAARVTFSRFDSASPSLCSGTVSGTAQGDTPGPLLSLSGSFQNVRVITSGGG